MTLINLILSLSLQSALAASADLSAPFDCLDLTEHPSGSQIYQDLRGLQKKLERELPDLAAPATAVGYCEKLSQTHIFAYLTTETLVVPPRCAGFTFSVQSRPEARAKAEQIVQIDHPQIKGFEGVIQLQVNEQTLRLPICLDILDELIGSPEKPRETPASSETEKSE